MCDNFLLLYHKSNIIDILDHLDKEKYFSVYINFIELLESDPKLANQLLSDPEISLKSWDQALFNVQGKLLHENDRTKCIIKNNVTCRIHKLPPWSHISFTTFPGQAHTGKFIQISGTVTRMSAKKLLEYQRQYLCTKCKYPITVAAQFDKMNIIKAPKRCTNPEGCGSKHIITFGELDPYNCKDYQEIKLQEDLSKPGIGSTPNHMIVILEDDLVDTCKPGENVTICGILKRRWSEFSKGEEMRIDIALKANHVQVNNNTGTAVQISDETRDSFKDFWEKYKAEPLVGRNVIIRSYAPELYGLHLVKLAIAMVLAGGTYNAQDTNLSTGIQTRAESHILLVGDPGTGKSEMLRFASKIVRRSVLTTGVGSTAAGLTVTAVMDKGHWQLEAGALVMSDGGICCIDEFNSMKEHDRTSIHEAMEQQTISVAKGGIVCKLKTRCSILAACNPKGNIDLSKPLCMNVAMSTPLLSRFDLVVLIRDTVNSENDKKLAQNFGVKNDEPTWNLEKLQAYYAVIKEFHPKLSDDAETILSTYYQLQRKLDTRNKSRTTVRLLESLIRLSQGHAKLMFHPEVQVMDTIFAVILVDAALDYDSSVLSLKVSNNSFCENPETTYRELGESILRKLNLEHIWKREINIYANDSDGNLFESLVPDSLEETSNLNEKGISQDFSSSPVDLQELATTHTKTHLDIVPSTSNQCSQDIYNNVSNKNQCISSSQKACRTKTSFPKFSSRFNCINESDFDWDKPIEFTKIKSQCNFDNSACREETLPTNLQEFLNIHTQKKLDTICPKDICKNALDKKQFGGFSQNILKTKQFPKFSSRFDCLNDNDFDLDKPLNFPRIKSQCNVKNVTDSEFKNMPQILTSTQTDLNVNIDASTSNQYSQDIFNNFSNKNQFTTNLQVLPSTSTSIQYSQHIPNFVSDKNQFASVSEKVTSFENLNDNNFNFNKSPNFRLKNIAGINNKNNVNNSEPKEVSQKLFKQENSQTTNFSQNSESGYSSINITTTDATFSSLIKSKDNSNVSQLSQIKKRNLLSQIGSQLDLDDFDKPSNYKSEILLKMKQRKSLEHHKNSASDNSKNFLNDSLNSEDVVNCQNNTLVNQNVIENNYQFYTTKKLDANEKPTNLDVLEKTKNIPLKNRTDLDNTFEEDNFNQDIISQIKNRANLKRNLTQENEDLLKQQRIESARQVSKILENYKAKQNFRNKAKMSDKANSKTSIQVSSTEKVLQCKDSLSTINLKLLENDDPSKTSFIKKDKVLISSEKKVNAKFNTEVLGSKEQTEETSTKTDSKSLQCENKTNSKVNLLCKSKKSSLDLFKCFELDSSESKAENYCDMDTTLSSKHNKDKKNIKNRDNKKRISSNENLQHDKAKKIQKLGKNNSLKDEVDDELNVLKNIPSVNDDFLKFNLDFDDTEFNF